MSLALEVDVTLGTAEQTERSRRRTGEAGLRQLPQQ